MKITCYHIFNNPYNNIYFFNDDLFDHKLDEIYDESIIISLLKTINRKYNNQLIDIITTYYDNKKKNKYILSKFSFNYKISTLDKILFIDVLNNEAWL